MVARREFQLSLINPTSCALDTVKGKIGLFQKTTNGFEIPWSSFSDVHRSSA
jgi:hypothetical protein